MNIEAVHSFELTLIQSLQGIKSPLLDRVIVFLNYFDSFSFYLLVVAITWYLYDRKVGTRLLFLFVLSAIVNFDLKELFSLPRPFQLSPGVGLAQVQDFGFPSGAAQTMTALFGFLALTIRKLWFSLIAIAAILIMSFSRVYLGVHFPSDILGGWVVGAILLGCFYAAVPFIGSLLQGQSKLTLLYLSLISTLILSFLSLDEKALWNLFFGFGASVGLIALPASFSMGDFFEREKGLCIALVGLIVLSFLTTLTLPLVAQNATVSMFVRIVSFFLTGLWFPCGAVLSQKKSI